MIAFLLIALGAYSYFLSSRYNTGTRWKHARWAGHSLTFAATVLLVIEKGWGMGLVFSLWMIMLAFSLVAFFVPLKSYKMLFFICIVLILLEYAGTK
ncbi:hypothetical protein [Leadbetterella byssophila]|uniref:DUF3325 domain-containing protein n=1 Tax=Leadbetterella byssophila (strain DSM 17132 / JCM 16389 / KACC 11308 / NBRC 106382 / 4M15) TaxID=649349 RepID=E4RVT1_LEAB4|nr:hypothetical protein [Leadbetterella byssophila]ADQ17979.1 hypothetical protein Lbys_2302 [Leadbetterella byssophila DSM 17132]